jgi:hypothetical protein
MRRHVSAAPETDFVTAVVSAPYFDDPDVFDIPEDEPPALYQPDEFDTPSRQRRRSLAAWYISSLLAVALLFIGYGGYCAANLLGVAVRAAARQGAETPTALAATVCNDLVHQNYGDLVAHIDHDPAPPAVTDSFDPIITTQTLQALDRSDGPVTSCSAQPLNVSQANPLSGVSGPDGATRVLLVIWRSGISQPIGAVLITRQGPTGAWLIERDSSFLLSK